MKECYYYEKRRQRDEYHHSSHRNMCDSTINLLFCNSNEGRENVMGTIIQYVFYPGQFFLFFIFLRASIVL